MKLHGIDVAISIVRGVFAENVNSLLQGIVSGLCGGYVASNLLNWYRWRFNGHGYFWGPVHRKVVARYPDFRENRNFSRDMFNVVVGTGILPMRLAHLPASLRTSAIT